MGGQGGIARRGGSGTAYIISNDLHKDLVKKTLKVIDLTGYRSVYRNRFTLHWLYSLLCFL